MVDVAVCGGNENIPKITQFPLKTFCFHSFPPRPGPALLRAAAAAAVTVYLSKGIIGALPAPEERC